MRCAMACLGYTCIRRMSSRYPVIAAREAVVSDEMLASVAGLDILRRGGNAADAALGMAACMQVLQPYGTGIGGDCFALHYDACSKKVRCVDGCGRSPAALTLELVESRSPEDWTRERYRYGLQATVPGAVKAWFYIANRFGSGKLSMSDLLAPAIRYAEDGVPMDHVKQALFRFMHHALQRMPGGQFFLNNGNQVPPIGSLLINRPLAALLKKLGRDGPRALYEGSVAESIAEAVHLAGGVMSTQDLSDHMNSVEPLDVEPASTTYRGDFTVHTTPLPTQGALLLQALNILDRVGMKGLCHAPGQFEHVVIEALRHAMGDGLRYIGDPATGGSLKKMLSPKRAQDCANMVNLHRRADIAHSEAAQARHGHSGTTFLAVADSAGNVCALMGSLSLFFGCTIVEEHGFCVQIRGLAFNQTPGHPNCFGPRKKPYHSLMPVMITDAHTQDWLGTMGTMAGLPQACIVIQLLLNMVELGLDPQQSLSKARFILGEPLYGHPDSALFVDPGFAQESLLALQQRGHSVNVSSEKRSFLNSGHANIMARESLWSREALEGELCSKKSTGNGLIWCGVEPRINGAALGY